MVSRVMNSPNYGGAGLNPGESLMYTLVAGHGNPLWQFACSDRKVFNVTAPHSQYAWYVINNRNNTPLPNPLWVPTDKLNNPDVYVVNLVFSQVQQYKLIIAKEPGNMVLQNITYISNDPGDYYPEPFTIISY
jgi:hypothetical protein